MFLLGTKLTTLCWEDCGSSLELWARKAIGYREINELFCRSLEDKIVAGSKDNGNLACEVSEGKQRLYQTFCVKNLQCLDSWT